MRPRRAAMTSRPRLCPRPAIPQISQIPCAAHFASHFYFCKPWQPLQHPFPDSQSTILFLNSRGTHINMYVLGAADSAAPSGKDRRTAGLAPRSVFGPDSGHYLRSPYPSYHHLAPWCINTTMAAPFLLSTAIMTPKAPDNTFAAESERTEEHKLPNP
ncbi:hypothetical protein CC78DRAFT_578007 [Lojkania enalia]|uniref:Uncharacterized protein n=1 Tax=Lojkania enalia TaxID=147567 RepID=A0A9P4KCF7_9PLEO|nr:hypothetical protein CC78DRAFT_578007 [Didymosphaeria enalia]